MVKPKELLRSNFSKILFFKVFGEVSVFFLFVLVAKEVSTGEFSSFSKTFNESFILATVFCFGSQNSIAKQSVSWISRGGIEKTEYIYSKFAPSLIIFLIMIVFWREEWFVLILGLMLSLSLSIKEILRATQQFTASEFPFSVTRAVFPLGILFVFVSAKLTITMQVLLAISIGSMLLNYIFLLHKNKLVVWAGVSVVTSANKMIQDSRESSSFLVQGAMRVLLERGDLILVVWFFGDNAAALFAAASRIAIFSNGIVEPLRAVIRPKIAIAHDINNKENIRNILRKSLVVSVAFSGAVLSVFIIFGEHVVSLFELGSSDVYLIMLNLCIGRTIANSFMPYSVYCNMVGKQKLYSGSIFVALVILGVGVYVSSTVVEASVYVGIAWCIVGLVPAFYYRVSG